MKNILTISREYGSGGYEIGQMVADALAFQFYDLGIFYACHRGKAGPA